VAHNSGGFAQVYRRGVSAAVHAARERRGGDGGGGGGGEAIRVLDIGAGSGLLSMFAAMAGGCHSKLRASTQHCASSFDSTSRSGLQVRTSRRSSATRGSRPPRDALSMPTHLTAV